jgi:hypothetical protein
MSNFSHYYGVLTPLNQWWKNLKSSRGLKCLVPFPACCQIGPPKDFEIKFVLNNGRNKFSFSCPCGLRYFYRPSGRGVVKILNLTLESGKIS